MSLVNMKTEMEIITSAKILSAKNCFLFLIITVQRYNRFNSTESLKVPRWIFLLLILLILCQNLEAYNFCVDKYFVLKAAI